MKTQRFTTIGLAWLLTIASAVACSDDEPASSSSSSSASSSSSGSSGDAAVAKNIVDTAVANGSFTILAAALTKADLIGTLKGPGPFTVLAPTDAAFQNVDPYSTVEKVNAITAPADIAALKGILLYHVISGVKATSDVVATLTSAKTEAPNGVTNGSMHVQIGVTGSGASAEIRVFPTKDRSNGASGASTDPGSKVVIANVEASNGVVHAMDTVLIPPSNDIVGAAQSYPALSNLVASLVANNLVAPLQGAGPFTVFAPANSATVWPMGGLPAGASNANILTQHVTNVTAEGATNFLTSGDVVKLTTAATKTIPSLLADNPIFVGGTATAPTLRGSATMSTPTSLVGASTTDIVTKNGIVHVVAEVLIPASLTL